jgi:DNA mismatch repair protein MutL
VADRIRLLPDNIANQIAAGEVIQRPASAVKELLENAIDAGKALIQVIDNGSGMSETDARMAFERHATSKIRAIDDLFHIRTMGFRGEALASIAAVAQVELKTRRAEDEVGVCIEVENSQVKKQEPVAAPVGTSIAMKNLFFNVPARRNFLKSNPAEMRHIVDEFMRVALSFPAVFFSMHSNGQQLFHLESGSLKQRIVQLLGNNYNTKLVPVKEETDYLNISGFVGKPETAKKTRGDQYFFVNNRFIKSAYLNHAVMSAYQEMIATDSFPAYTLFIDLDPTQVDVNVHPTKQEIKFEDEKIVYAFVQAAVKHALAQFSITPTLDFNLDASIQQLSSVQQPFTTEKKAFTQGSSLFQTFTQANQAHAIEGKGSNFRHWSDLESNGTPTENLQPEDANALLQNEQPAASLFTQYLQQPAHDEVQLTQLFNTYILVPAQQHFLLVHQQAAHERVLYDRLQKAMLGKPVATQRSLFPATIDVAPQDAALLTELLPDLQQIGYLVEPFGANSFVVQGTPADVTAGFEKQVLENLLEQYKHFSAHLQFGKREVLVRAVSVQQAIKAGTPLSSKEMMGLISDLFACTQNNTTPSGRPTFVEFQKDTLDKTFGR